MLKAASASYNNEKAKTDRLSSSLFCVELKIVHPYMRVPVHLFFHPQPPSSDPVGVASL